MYSELIALETLPPPHPVLFHYKHVMLLVLLSILPVPEKV